MLNDEGGGPCGALCTMCCGIFVLLPLAVWLTAWNEQTAVCRQWAIEAGARSSVLLRCDASKLDQNGGAVNVGDLGFLACSLDQSTFPLFKETNVTGVEQVKNLFGSSGVKAAALSMTVKMWQCEEYCTRSVQECDRRLGIQELDVSKGRAASQFEISSQLRRLKGRDRTCHTVCREHGYKRVLQNHLLDTNFDSPSRAKAQCGSSYSVPTPEVGLGTKDFHAPSETVSTIPNKVWSLNSYQVKQLPINLPLRVEDRRNGHAALEQPPAILTSSNTFVSGGKLYSCAPGTQDMGCLEIEFKRAVPKKVAMLSAVGSLELAKMNAHGWNAPSYWVCNADAGYSNINNFCPSKSSVDVHRGVSGCGEEVSTIGEMIADMKTANAQKMWLLRVIGFLVFYCAVSSCLQPIRSMIDLIANVVDSTVALVPCMPSCLIYLVDVLTDIFTGVVSCILCIVSCFFGSACFLSVVVVMWIVMRPLMGVAMSLLLCGFCGGGSALLYMNRKPNSRDKTARQPMLTHALEMPDATCTSTLAPAAPVHQAAVVLTSMAVTCPEGVAPGGAITILTPNGQQLQVTVPMGVSTGQQFFVQVPT